MGKKLISTVLCAALLLQLSFSALPMKAAYAGEKTSFMYLYGGNTDTYIRQLEKTQGSVNTISPNFFNLTNDGQLIASVDTRLVEYAHQKGMKVVPFLSNHWDLKQGQQALYNYKVLAKQIADAIAKYNLDGINIDLENITNKEKGHLNLFVDELQRLLPVGKTVSIAVAAVQKNTTTGWAGAYDLAHLGKSADYVIIMGYDEHWDGGEAGPVASLPWVKNTLDYMTTQIPSHKLVLGVPFYGRVWTNGSDGTGVTYATAMKQVEKYNTSVHWHDQYQSPYLKYTNEKGQKKELWFENKSSIQAKVNMVQQYNLKGAAAWRLGQEDTSIWSSFSNWLNGSGQGSTAPFGDIKGHWAQGEIEFLYNLGHVRGEPGQKFNPDKAISRAEALAILSRITSWNRYTSYSPFHDVPESHWAVEPIVAAYDHNMLSNLVVGNSFTPSNALKRGETAALIQRAFNLSLTDPTNVFSDVPTNHWAKEEIAALVAYGFMDPVNSTTFGINNSLSKAEFCAILARILR